MIAIQSFDGAAIIQNLIVDLNVPPSSVDHVSLGPASPYNTQVLGAHTFLSGPMIPSAFPAGIVIRSETEPIQAGDKWTEIALVVYEKDV